MLAKLTRGSLDVVTVFRAESMGLNLSERDATATITLGPDAPEIAPGDWIQDLTEPGKGIVWRARSVDTQYDRETRTITLEHMLQSLRDRVIPTEVKGSDMGGTDESCSARTAATYVLSLQSDWVLGDFDYSVANAYKFDGDTLLAAMETISGTLEDPIWEYNFSVYPFRLHVHQLSDDAGAEMRAGRNISTLKYTIDRSRMYTRFYPVGKENLRLDGGGYVSRNEALYGRVDKTETDQSKATQAELAAWADERLQKHAEPSVTVTISGLDLSEATGEALDKLTIGKRCRVPLPKEGTLISEKVTKLSWRDKVKDPESVTVTLANALQDVQTIVREEQRKSGGGGRAAAKVDEENRKLIGETASGIYSYIIQTSTNIIMHVHDTLQGYSTIEQTASAITLAVSTAQSDNWSLIQQTATNILMTVGNTLQGYSTIEQTASAITLAVNTAGSNLYNSIIQQTATNIHMAVSNAATGIYSAIDVQANRISLVVQGTGENARIRPAQIVAAINNGASSITISADHIDIDGLVESLEAKDVMVQHFNAAGGEFTEDLSVLGDLDVAGDTAVQGLTCGALSASSLKVGSNSASWKSATLKEPMIGVKHYFMYASAQGGTTAAGTVYAGACLGTTDTTIYYLGHS